MGIRGFALLAVALAACSGEGDNGVSRQDCEAVIAHLVVLEKLGNEPHGPMCKYHLACDGGDRHRWMDVCPRVLTRKEQRCYQRATSLSSADDCLARSDLDERIQAGTQFGGDSYGGSKWLGVGGGPAATPEERALRDLDDLKDDACKCRDADCATKVEDRFQDIAGRLGNLDRTPGLRDRAQQVAEAAMKCLAAAVTGPDAGAPYNPYGTYTYNDPWAPAPDAGVAGSTGLPSCDAYIAGMEAYMNCPAMSYGRDSIQQSIDYMRQSYAAYTGYSADVRAQADQSCKTALDTLRSSAASLGCTIP